MPTGREMQCVRHVVYERLIDILHNRTARCMAAGKQSVTGLQVGRHPFLLIDQCCLTASDACHLAASPLYDPLRLLVDGVSAPCDAR